MEEVIGKYDSGIDASTLTYDISSMTLNSFDSSFSSIDVLNRARIDSIDDDPSIKDDLNEAQFLDTTGLSLDDSNFHETHINFSVTLTNTPIHNKENIYNNQPVTSVIVADVQNIQRSLNGRKPHTGHKNEVPQADRERKAKAKPLSPSKDIQNSSSNANHVCNRPKKGSYRKQNACNAKASPPKSQKMACKDYCQSQFNSPKKSKQLPQNKTQNKNLKNSFQSSTASSKSKPNQKSVKSKMNNECIVYSNSEQDDTLEESDTSIYVTPLQTPSKLHTETFSPCSRLSDEEILNSPNITVRSPSPYKTLSPNITVRSYRHTCSPLVAASSSSDVDGSEYPLPHPHHSKTYFSPILDDSAIVEASCSGRKYRSPPKYLNLETSLEADCQADDTCYKKETVRHLFADAKEAKDWDSIAVYDHSPLANMLENLFEHSGSSYLLSPKYESSEHTYAEFQDFLRKLEGTNKISSKKSVCDEHSSPRSSPLLSPLCCDSRPPDQLSEAELDEITWIHTTCNGQQVAPRVQIGQSCEEFTVFPPPRTPRHLKWNMHLEQDCDSVEKQQPNCSTPLKPILRKRPENHVFPYNGDNPSPYIITKTRQVNSLV
ncbi:uncharacterized protein LOC115215825 [Octopus sinensis]|uniref:Uncharacterized protein LOC115215825 n=1 Tax=Octopus sinensis TaxID=2607531 RepID=A0A6P7SRT6_9MOLL|nr:uncharacterized protein LOC115215825 [Octopus sinensis]